MIQCSWEGLVAALAAASDLDGLIGAHSAFLSAVVQKAMLGPENAPLLEALDALFETILRFAKSQELLYIHLLEQRAAAKQMAAAAAANTAAGGWGAAGRGGGAARRRGRAAASAALLRTAARARRAVPAAVRRLLRAGDAPRLARPHVPLLPARLQRVLRVAGRRVGPRWRGVRSRVGGVSLCRMTIEG